MSLTDMMGDVAEYERQNPNQGGQFGTLFNAVLTGEVPPEMAAEQIVQMIESAPDQQAAMAEVEAMLEQMAAEGGGDMVRKVAEAIMALLSDDAPPAEAMPEGMEDDGPPVY